MRSSLRALILKEIQQTLRDRRLIFLLLVLPLIQLLSYGFALNPDINHLELGIVDWSKSSVSREFIAALTDNNLFTLTEYSESEKTLSRELKNGSILVGVVIPPDFQRRLSRQTTALVQVLIDGMNANTAGIAKSYLSQIINNYNRKIMSDSNLDIDFLQVTFIYNPGLVSSWFFVCGILGIVLTFVGSIVAASAVVREKEFGTLEQLLMTPASNWEVLLAKTFPLLLLLLADTLLFLFLSHWIFGVPLGHNLFLTLGVSGLYILGVLELGIFIGTIFATQQQTQLVTFSLNVPMVLLCGAISPIESMPAFFQNLSWLNPLRHYVAFLRGILLKDSGLEILWLQILCIGLFVTVLFPLSIRKFQNLSLSKN
jgi:ABC-2 type transport system permease protein